VQAMVDADAFNAFEAAGWEQSAAGYHAFFAELTGRVVHPLLDAGGVGRGTRVLDVATGPGYVAGAAAGRGARVSGIDISSAMVALARRMHPAVEFLEADAQAIPFDAARFDVVTGNFVILHLGRPERAAAEFARVLAPGGRVALTAWDLPERTRVLGVVLDALAEAGAAAPQDIPVGPAFFRFSVDDEFAGLLTAQGLADVEVETIAFTHPVSSAGALWQGVLRGTVRTSALILGQSPGMRARIRDALEERVGEYRRGDRLELPVSVKLAVGRKPA
jgi:ubiquinone/menaquinone biosynthesis C-methylase UbiE